MKANQLTLSALTLAALAFTSACGPFDSYNDYLQIKGTIVAADGVTPVVGQNLDQIVASFVVDGGAEIIRTITYTDKLGYQGNFFSANGVSDTGTDGQLLPAGQFDLLRHNLDLYTIETRPNYIQLCTDRDRDGYCIEYTTVQSGTKNVTVEYALNEIQFSKSSISFRFGSADVTLPGQEIFHGQTPKVDEGGRKFRRTWLMEDRYVSPFTAAAAANPEARENLVMDASVKTLAKPHMVDYATLSAAKKAQVDADAVSANAFLKRIAEQAPSADAGI